jgi:hypothetical protein
VDKFFSHLAADAAVDQLLLHLTSGEFPGEVRVIVWLAALAVQFCLMRRWVLAWAGLEKG